MTQTADSIHLFTDASLVRAGCTAIDWRDAVQQATGLLVRAGYVTERYPEKVIAVIERYGPYTVIAPGLALVHAQPSADSLRTGAAAAAFPDGVDFGHAYHDPVSLVIAVASTSPAAHIDLIASIAARLEADATLVQRAIAAPTSDSLRETLLGLAD